MKISGYDVVRAILLNSLSSCFKDLLYDVLRVCLLPWWSLYHLPAVLWPTSRELLSIIITFSRALRMQLTIVRESSHSRSNIIWREGEGAPFNQRIVHSVLVVCIYLGDVGMPTAQCRVSKDNPLSISCTRRVFDCRPIYKENLFFVRY